MIKDRLITDIDTILKVSVSTVLLFMILILIVSISGLRSFAKMSSIDFASTIAIGSVLASSILGESPSVIRGGLAVGFIYSYKLFFLN